MDRHRRTIFGISAAAALSLLPGCVYVGPRSILRGWADWNTYGQWSVSVERLDHLPPRRPRVETMLWQYGAGPTGRCCADGLHAGSSCGPHGERCQPPGEPTPIPESSPAPDASPPPIVPTSGTADAGRDAPIRPGGAWVFRPESKAMPR